MEPLSASLALNHGSTAIGIPWLLADAVGDLADIGSSDSPQIPVSLLLFS